jgi:hypothetical protein
MARNRASSQPRQSPARGAGDNRAENLHAGSGRGPVLLTLLAACGCSAGGYTATYLERVAEYEALDVRLAKPPEAAPPAEGQPEGEAPPKKPDDPIARLYERIQGGGADPAAQPGQPDAAAPERGPRKALARDFKPSDIAEFLSGEWTGQLQGGGQDQGPDRVRFRFAPEGDWHGTFEHSRGGQPAAGGKWVIRNINNNSFSAKKGYDFTIGVDQGDPWEVFDLKETTHGGATFRRTQAGAITVYETAPVPKP